MFSKIFDNKKYEKYFINRILIILDLIKDSNFINIFKKDMELKNNYLKLLQNINIKSFSNNNDVLNNIIDFLNIL